MSFPIERISWSRPFKETIKDEIITPEVDMDKPSKLVITFIDTAKRERIHLIYEVTDVKVETEKINE